MSTSRREILDALRRGAPPDAPLPDVSGIAARYADPVRQLGDAVAAVGGTLVRVADAAALETEARALAAKVGARRIASAVPGAGAVGNVALDALADPHELEGLDLAILPGVFAVAENGAVWVSGRAFRPRGAFVVAQHLALVVAAPEIVNDMHEAYDRLAREPKGYGLFIAGPSKTADIEQALVIG
ncbi:MAG TPA: LUD domain-containing protein, partial [Anaeromyxobacteraceae bacterium]|nr:LUD domain-containing protein [Anaeromyxobacteraceae bacterium]